MSPRVLFVVGARPNFVKVAPVLHALRAGGGIDVALLHTGQHYDRLLSGAFFEQLELPLPAFALGVGSGSHAEQTAAVLVGVARVLEDEAFDTVVVPGDVNSTVAAALAAAKLGVRVVHLEAGLRSGDWTMPEEVNRVVTDRLSDLLLCPSADAHDNLLAEGVADARIAVVGNTMIDTLVRLLPSARERGTLARLGLAKRGYVLVTLHRPALVDDPTALAATLAAMADVARGVRLVFPVHPRTRARLVGTEVPAGVELLEPLDYLDFLAIQESARLVVTDSGGVQEETSYLGVPCLTYRTTTERPITVTQGTNRLVGRDPEALREACAAVLAAPAPPARAIPLWDGAAGERAAGAIRALLASSPEQGGRMKAIGPSASRQSK